MCVSEIILVIGMIRLTAEQDNFRKFFLFAEVHDMIGEVKIDVVRVDPPKRGLTVTRLTVSPQEQSIDFFFDGVHTGRSVVR